jgi:S1-C subfamily serine protease
MRILPVTLTACFVLLPSLAACAPTWADTVATVEHSIVRLEFTAKAVDFWTGKEFEARATCTGFSIHEQYGYFMTAAHCLNNGTANGLTADKYPARLLYRNDDLDLAVLAVDLHKPALSFSLVPLRKGDEIGTLGFGYGLTDSLFRAGYVAHPSIDLSEFELPNLWLAFSAPYIGGMSGGPVFDRNGQVVGLVQLSDNLTGFGITIDEILNATRQYWQYGSVE